MNFRWLRLPSLVGMTVIVATLTAYAQVPADDPLVSLANRLETVMPKADVCVLIDASGSMTGKYDAVRAAALRFAEGLSPRETLMARVFAAVVSQPMQGSGDEARAALEAGMPTTPLPGRGTDLGLALAKALDDLNRPDAAPVQMLFVLTDGLHEPPPDSPYSRSFLADPEWQMLRQRGHDLASRTRLTVYGMGIGGATDIEVLRTVFPAQNVEIATGDAAGAARALQSVLRRLRLERLRTLLQEDLGSGEIRFSLAPPSRASAAGRYEVILTVENRYKALPVLISELTLTPANGSGSPVSFTENITVEPNKTVSRSFEVEPKFDAHRWQLGRMRLTLPLAYEPRVQATFPDETALRALQLPARPRYAREPVGVSITDEVGIPWWLVIGTLLAFVGTVIGWFRRQTIHPQTTLVGTISFGTEVVELSNYGRSTLTCGAVGADIEIPGATETVQLELQQDGDYVQLAASASGVGVTVNGEPLGTCRLINSGDELTLGGATVTILNDGRTKFRYHHPALLRLSLIALVVFILLGVWFARA